MKWISKSLANLIHDKQISYYGGLPGLRDEGLLISALNRPKDLYGYTDPKPSIYRLAASYAYGMALNHLFIDGNKRTAFVTSAAFLELNGFILSGLEIDKYAVFMSLVDGRIDEETMAFWLEKRCITA
jgi:death-on-curing protein